MITEQEKRKVLKDNGWSTYYNPNYWVHPKAVEDPSVQNYTNYGFSLDDAYKFETQELKAIKSFGMPELSKHLYTPEKRE